jgi:hypothetical protein
VTLIRGETLQVGSGSNILAEGNVFKNAQIQNNGDLKTQFGGKSFVPFRPEDSTVCSQAIGRPCVINLSLQSSKYNFALEAQALASFKVSHSSFSKQPNFTSR